MDTRHKLALTAALLLGLLAAPLHADSAPGALAPALAGAATTHVERGERARRLLHVAGDPALSAIRQMRLIERIHLRQNHPERAIAMYRSVLERTQNIMIRNVANARLAQLVAWQPRDHDAALAELQRGLDENLAKVP